MLDEMGEPQATNLFPKLVQADNNLNFFMAVHNFREKGAYKDQFIDSEAQPESLPVAWAKLASQGNHKSQGTQYMDPNLIRKLTKKYQNGRMLYLTQFINIVTKEVVHEHSHGFEEPSRLK